MKELVLEFKGYWTEKSKSFIPDRSGVFCVYRAKLEPMGGKLQIRQLIYIGESERVKSEISAHEAKNEWKTFLKPGEILCFNFAPILYDRNRVEAALIHHHKPVVNREFLWDYPYSDTAVFTTGRNLLLSECFAALESSAVSDFGWMEL